MSDNLETLDLLADLGTLSNTRATAKGIAIQNQMLFDAMTPEEQARVIAAAEARIAAREERKQSKQRRRGGYAMLCVYLVGVGLLVTIIGTLIH
jgi:predicted anti-sigma-YlaC factor YlaD